MTSKNRHALGQAQAGQTFKVTSTDGKPAVFLMGQQIL